jgi:serine/threonine protein kinase/tetratricopeptide (TPR) repeat protein
MSVPGRAPGVGPSDPDDALTTFTASPEEALTIAPARAGASPTDDGPLHVGQSFGTRYHIIKLLGIGGMGAVYQAWDSELSVAVAIKVIRPDAMADAHVAAEVERRFKRELLLAREVTHKNVVRIFDLGDIGGMKYITMSFVDGVDLASILKRDGRQPVPDVMRIARAVVSGLVSAHAAGVVHRDLKPANVMVRRDGEALIMDFGIALSTAEPTAPAASTYELPEHLRNKESQYAMTTMGGVAGTVEYMAPEQAQGRPADQRVDVYALGLILYDALVGKRRAETAGDKHAELQSRMSAAPPAVRTLVPEVPAALDALVTRCLDPDPEKRYQTAAQVAADLARLDDDGIPIPVKRVVGLPLVASLVLLLTAVSLGTWWYFQSLIPPAQHEPVAVLIADIANTTGDESLQGTLEPMLRLSLEEAGFVNAFDRALVRSRLGERPPATFDEAAAVQIAVKQGVRVVLAGSVAPRGEGYVVTLKASEAVTGEVIRRAEARASGKDQILPAAAKLAYEIREALGDDTSEAGRRFAADTLSATSIEVVRQYATAMVAVSDGRFDEARKSFEAAVRLDPTFGLAYTGMASMARNLIQPEEAERNIREAMRHVGRMTERERYRTRGLFFTITHQYPQCVEEFRQLIAKYAADVAARNNLAVCLTQVRKLPEAVAEMRETSRTLPRRALYRVNLGLYASYATDFAAGEEAAMAALEIGGSNSALGYQPLAFAQLGQGRIADAAESYRKFAAPLTPSQTASGLADIAVYEGRYSEAVNILERAAAEDVKGGNKDMAAAKFAALAHAQMLRNRPDAAAAAASSALDYGSTARVRFLAARLLAQTGNTRRAGEIAGALRGESQAEAQAYARIVEGNIALAQRDTARAMTVLTEATGILDTWIGKFDLGRAYLEAGRFVEADSAFDGCLSRRGEAMSLFLDEEPTYGYLPMVHYYQGRARETSGGAADSYRTYLDIRGAAGEDPQLADLRRRLNQASTSL